MSYKCLLWSPVLSRICLSLWWNKNSLQLSAGFVGDGAYMHTYVNIYYYLKVCCNVPSFHKKYNIIHLWHGCDGNIKIYLPSDELIFKNSEPSCHLLLFKQKRWKIQFKRTYPTSFLMQDNVKRTFTSYRLLSGVFPHERLLLWGNSNVFWMGGIWCMRGRY